MFPQSQGGSWLAHDAEGDDLTFPDPVTFAYYAIYNCFRKHACGEEIDPWLIVNQALSSNDNKESWVPRLTQAMATAI